MKNLLLMLISISIIACNSGDKTGKKMSADGYEYTILESGNGNKIMDGDVVFFEIDILDPVGNVLQSRESFRSKPTMLIDSKAPKPQGANPVRTVLSTSSVGDSIELIMPKDSMQNPPATMKEIDFVKYILVVKEAKTKASIEAEEAALKTKSAVRETEVAALVSTTIQNYKSKKSEVVTLESGLEYILHEEGTGEFPKVGENVNVNYYGVLLEDGKMFDNSFQRGSGFQFPLGQGRVIKGWDEGIAKLKKGSKATLIIPGDMGYGKAGSPPRIPGDATLVFYVELF